MDLVAEPSETIVFTCSVSANVTSSQYQWPSNLIALKACPGLSTYLTFSPQSFAVCIKIVTFGNTVMIFVQITVYKW